MSVMFPIDYRYGWGLSSKPHRDLFDSVRKRLPVRIMSSELDCRVWSRAQTTVNKVKRDAERRSQGPMLNWLADQNEHQARVMWSYFDGNPAGSYMWALSPLSETPRGF